MAAVQIMGKRMQTEGTGLQMVEIPYFCDTEGEAIQLRPSPPAGGNLFLGGKSFEDIGAGKVICRCQFYGIDTAIRKSTVEVSGDFAKSPIERTKKIKELVDKYSGEVDPTTQQVIFPQSYSSGGSGLGGGSTGTNPMFGVRYQDLPRFQIAVRYIHDSEPFNFNSVGKKVSGVSVAGISIPTDLSPYFIVQPPSMRTIAKEIGGSRAIWEIQESIVQYDNDVCPDELYQTGSFSSPPF